MEKDGIAEAVFCKGVQCVILACLINCPVSGQFFRAEYQNFRIQKLKVFDNGKRFVGFAKANTVGNDAAVVFQDFIDGAFYPVFLKLV